MSRQQQLFPLPRLLGSFILLLLVIAGCAVEHGKVYVKDGKQYGVTSSQIWRGRWWNYYERGVSYADGEFWDEATADFQAAITQRQDDQRRARTYGLHFMDYFPHRELGIVYYHRKRYPEASRALETSLASVDNARAKFYLNKTRKALLQQTGRDAAPPRILLASPADGLLTNRFSVTVTGHAEDDTYVAAVAVNGRAQFIELAEPRIPFTQEVALHDGANTVDIVAVDLLGRTARQRRTVQLDRQGPLLSLDSVEVLGAPPLQRARVEGFVADRSRLVRFVLAGRHVPLQAETDWAFRAEVPLVPGTTSLPFEVEDAAGNITRGDIALTLSAGGPPGSREGRPIIELLPRWTSLDAGTMRSDLEISRGTLQRAPTGRTEQRGVEILFQKVPQTLDARLRGHDSQEVIPAPAGIQEPYIQLSTALVALHPTPIRTAQRSDREPPVIKLTNLTDRDTVYDDSVYLEGQVIDASAITAFTVNGESLWRRQARQLFFGQKFALQPGENHFRLEAVDEAGNTTQRTIVVLRDVPRARQLGSRLRLTAMPFETQGTPSGLAETVHDSLLNAFVGQQRFAFVERHKLEAILRELKLSQTDLVDPATAAKTGKIAAAEGILIGTVTEMPRALAVYMRFVDVETSAILAAEDVYGEDLTLPSVKTLMEGLSWKLQRHFPLVEGLVLEKTGQNLFTDLARGHGVKQYMKLIVFREGEARQHPGTGRLLKKPDEVLAEARITAVSDESSQATLLTSESARDVRELDKVITK